jgi:bifunctional oligoribonuclease and PAP phosphatase NrnA
MLTETHSPLALYPAELVQRLMDRLENCGPIVITTHPNPDGDAMGSSLALALVLKKMGKQATVVVPNAFDLYLSWLEGTPDVVDASTKPADAAAMIAGADLIFCLDYNALRRVGELEPMITNSPGEKVLIDHHLDPQDFAQYNFHVAGLSSTAEMVYRLLLQMGAVHHIDKGIAANIYVGLMTDTGSFRFSTTTPEVHLIAAELLKAGIDVGHIHNLIYDNFGEKRLRFLGYMLYKKLKVLPEYHTAYMAISRGDGARFDLQAGDTEGLVNYALSLKGVHFGVLLKASDKGTKLSFRSIGKFSCNEFAAHFGGGGHHNASGGRVDLNLEATEAKFLEVLKDYKDALDY